VPGSGDTFRACICRCWYGIIVRDSSCLYSCSELVSHAVCTWYYTIARYASLARGHQVCLIRQCRMHVLFSFCHTPADCRSTGYPMESARKRKDVDVNHVGPFRPFSWPRCVLFRSMTGLDVTARGEKRIWCLGWLPDGCLKW
jgi:hypothetical protein